MAPISYCIWEVGVDQAIVGGQEDFRLSGVLGFWADIFLGLSYSQQIQYAVENLDDCQG